MPTTTAAPAAPAKGASGQKAFTYRARASDGRITKGLIEAPTRVVAASKLTAMGLAPVQLKEKAVGTGLNRDLDLAFLSGGIKTTDLAVVTRQLATMTASGLALLRAITVVAEQTQHPKLKAVLLQVAREVETGTAFSEALAKHSEIPVVMISIVRAGETGGFLDTALDSLAQTFEKEAKLRSTIKSAMTYPVVVLGIAVLAVIAMLLFIVPVFANMFKTLGSELPLPTQFLVTLSNQMFWLLPTGAVLAVGASMGWKRIKDREAVRRVVHPVMLKIPVFGPLIAKVAISRFSRNLSNMTTAGVPLLKALAIVGQTSNNWVLEQTAARVGESIRVGGSMAEPLGEEKLFPAMVVQMIAVGEESGSVDDMLGKVADFYDSEIDATAAALTSLIEPLLITFLGVVVGGMVVALYLPIFAIATALH